MKKAVGGVKIIVFVALIAAIILYVTIDTAKTTYNDKLAAEKYDTLDYHLMMDYCQENAEAVMKALASGKADKLDKLMINPRGTERVMKFADWSKADFKNAVSMGAGSLTTKTDKDGCIDVSERFFVDVGDDKYMFFIETVASKWGRVNEGVSAVSVTTFSHFDATDYAWNGEDDGESAQAGTLFWKR